ncbi:hypothetical protein [Boudabousia liubingyangii]|uniref:hypothetical protein n=1 Tax=Boudabousia liubingyangii TaxID=1921764 RepID=UPI000F7A8CE2|nr:hypothetical protein [Boudabousia liubingyangii]
MSTITSDSNQTSDEPIVTSLLVHKPLRYPAAWWKSAVIADVPGLLGVDELNWLSAQSLEFAKAGCDALIVRPAKLNLDEQGQVLADLIKHYRRAGTKVIVRLCGGLSEIDLDPHGTFYDEECDQATTLKRAEQVFSMGAAGLDLGLLPPSHVLDEHNQHHPWQPAEDSDSEESGTSDEGAPQLSPRELQCGRDDPFALLVRKLHKVAYNHSPGAIISAFAVDSNEPTFDRHLEYCLYHHLRDDTLLESPWEAQALRDRIGLALTRRDRLGHVAAWRASSSFTELTYASDPTAWFAQNAPVRRRALTLLSLSLPGAVYIRASRLLKLPWLEGLRTYAIMSEEDRRFARNATTRASLLRKSRSLGVGSLAWVSGLDWAGPEVFVQAGANTLTVLNTSDHPIEVPDSYLPLMTSREINPTEDDDSHLLNPDECGWYAFPEAKPVQAKYSDEELRKIFRL